MPGMGGEKLIELLSRESRMPPALVITGMSLWRTSKLLEYGIGYIMKPIDSKMLLDTIGAMLSKEDYNGHSVTC